MANEAQPGFEGIAAFVLALARVREPCLALCCHHPNSPMTQQPSTLENSRHTVHHSSEHMVGTALGLGMPQLVCLQQRQSQVQSSWCWLAGPGKRWQQKWWRRRWWRRQKERQTELFFYYCVSFPVTFDVHSEVSSIEFHEIDFWITVPSIVLELVFLI